MSAADCRWGADLARSLRKVRNLTLSLRGVQELGTAEVQSDLVSLQQLPASTRACLVLRRGEREFGLLDQVNE